MARGKNSRRKSITSSNPLEAINNNNQCGPATTSITKMERRNSLERRHSLTSCRCANCLSNNNNNNNNNHHNNNHHNNHHHIPKSLPATLGHTSQQDVLDSIDYHWKILSHEVKHFLLEDPMQLCLKKLVEFWSAPSRKESSLSGQVAASISGSSFFLALNYTFVDRIKEARALILNGAFLRQCIATPIEEIAKLASSPSQSTDVSILRVKIPIYCTGLVAASTTKEAMDRFLNDTLPPDYRRRMTFASQAASAKNPVGDYVSLISSDWNGSNSGNSYSRRRSLDASAAAKAAAANGEEEASLEIVLVDGHSKEETKVPVVKSTMLKTIFSNYAEERDVSMRSLRFSYGGRTLFLTEVGNKSLEDFGMSNLDRITITNLKKPKQDAAKSASAAQKQDKDAMNSPPSSPTSSSNESSSPSSTTNIKIYIPKKKFKRTNSMPEVDDRDKFKISHSRHLTRLFEEAEPKLKEIRQKLNALNVQNTQPKKKTYTRRHSVAADPNSQFQKVDNPPTEGLGGKAGKICHHIQVGAVENLYKTTKPAVYARRNSNQFNNPASHSSYSAKELQNVTIDLHGYTREEALEELDRNLPVWVDIAMKGSYPFVLPVKVVCGGGSQILSETVERWVKGNERVSNAPKMMVGKGSNRRASIQ